MKNFTNNFKQFTSRLSARWLIMALMMLVGTSSAWAATISSDGTARLYFNMSSINWWISDNGNNNFAYFFNNSTGKNSWSAHSVQHDGNTYYVTIPKGDWAGVILTRNNTTSAPSWNNKWNQTGDITLSSASNYISKFSEGSASVTWGTAVIPASTASVTAASTSIKVGESTALSAALTSNADINTLKSATYATTDGASVSDNTFTATTPGTYTVTATVTYHPNAYTDLTSTATATTTITVEDPCTLPSEISISGAATPCANAKNVSYTATITGGNAYELVWSVTGDGYSIAEGHGTTTAKINVGAGQGTVKCTAQCSSTSTKPSDSFTVKPYSPTKPTLTISPASGYICEGEEATITIASPELNVQTLTYQLYNVTDGEAVGSKITPTSSPVKFTATAEGTYRVDVGHTCGGTVSANTVNVFYYAAPEIPKFSTTNPTICNGTSYNNGVIAMGNSLPGITYTLKKGNVTYPLDQDGTKWSNLAAGTYTLTASQTNCTTPQAVSESVKLEVEEISPVATVSIISASYDMNTEKFSVTGQLNHVGCSQDVYVGYRYKLVGTDTWGDLINISHLTGDDAVNGAVFSKNDITISNIAAGQKYLFQTYAINGYPNYQETSAVLSSSTIEVEVQDGYTVYVRRPKSGDATNVYTNWYELSSVKGGAPYVKRGAINGSATTDNTGGTEMTYAFTDCDGYIWDSFKPAKDQTEFHIHALNDIQQGGWGTFSKTATITAGKDNYFYLSAWSSGTYGVTITSTDQPTRGVRIKALGSTEVISNNMASFAAISFNGNCTGKELLKDAEGDPTGFQWKYSAPETSSWSNYNGEGATWNNIRPTKAGKYKLVCTMEDMTTVESNEVTITTTSKNYNATDLINIKSNLPIIMVNTGDNNGFPACSVAGSDYPSKHADKFKEKLSVDVKIKVGDNIVYDKKARMAYRGSSSLNFKKKSYAFCPGADMCGLDEDKSPDYVDTKKMDMLDLITGGTKKSAKDKDWVLYAATPDPSMMRNILAMETFSAMTGKWGVKNQYVELYVDGEYQGVYVFMDKITQNEKRVNVSWNVDGSSKGFIVKFDKTDLADRYEIPNGDQKTFESAMKTGNTGVISYYTEIDQRFEIEYPEKDKVIKAGGSWADVYTFVKGKIDAFESALKDGDFNTVRTIIDYKSWADFFILTEFAKNGDGYRASCVFVYEGGLLKAYPLWDYELSFDNETRQEHGINETTGLLVNSTTYSKVSGNDGTFPAPFWWTGNYYNNKQYKGLLDDPCFISMVNARWEEHTKAGGALSEAKLKELVSKYNTALTTTDATTNKVGEVTLNTPQKREAQKWPYDGATRGKTCNDKTIGYYGQGAGNAISEVEDFSASKSTLDTWIGDGDTGRRKGLKAEIDKLLEDVEFAITVVADKTTTTPWRPVTVTVNSNSGYEYSITPEPAKLEENGHMYTLYFARPERTEGQNFTTVEDAYTFTATTGQADQCGTTQGSTTSAEVKIDLADVEENCD